MSTNADRNADSQLDLFRSATAVAAPPGGGAAAPPQVKAVKADPSQTRPGNGAGPRRRRKRTNETAQTLARHQRDISISEFFTKNRHLLGFDNPVKALLTTVKEAVDNALDACEDAGILPDVQVEIRQLAENRFRVSIEDNGPGIIKAEIPKIFAKLLYGSKFHVLKQSRGQQGIGISAAGMYGQLTTGKPVAITSKTGKGRPAHHYKLHIDTRKNQPVTVEDTVTESEQDSGTRVSIELEATYKKGRRSVDDYIAQTAVANPHARIAYTPPRGERLVYDRIIEELPPEPLSMKPHPYGVELGALIRMLHDTRERTLQAALSKDFSRVSPRVAKELVDKAGLKASASPRTMKPALVEKLFRAIPQVKIRAPSANCLSPIGQERLIEALKQWVPADFYATITRAPQVYRGMPFQVEVGLAWGGGLPADELVELRRFANRVPLLYQQAGCAVTKAVTATDWRKYGLSQSRGALPSGPVMLLVHIASAWVPFTSESKEAIAHYPEILKEIRLGLMEVGRKLGGFVRARRRAEIESRKRTYIEKYIPHIGIGLQQILGLSDAQRERTVDTLTQTLRRSRAGK